MMEEFGRLENATNGIIESIGTEMQEQLDNVDKTLTNLSTKMDAETDEIKDSLNDGFTETISRVKEGFNDTKHTLKEEFQQNKEVLEHEFAENKERLNTNFNNVKQEFEENEQNMMTMLRWETAAVVIGAVCTILVLAVLYTRNRTPAEALTDARQNTFLIGAELTMGSIYNTRKNV